MKLDKVLIIGSPDIVVPTMESIVEVFPSAQYLVMSQPDKVRGRGRELSPTPVKKAALEMGLPVKTPESKADIETEVRAFEPDLVVVFAYGMILPKAITDDFFCVNIHGSVLPQYRGASPIQAALLNGDDETGITIIRMNEKMDEGDILFVAKFEVSPDDNFEILHEKMAYVSAQIFPTFMIELSEGKMLDGAPQDHSQATYCGKIQKEDLQLHLSEAPEIVHNKVRAFSPIPCAWIDDNGRRLKILESKIEDGYFVPVMVKPEGKGKMRLSEYLLGNQDSIFKV